MCPTYNASSDMLICAQQKIDSKIADFEAKISSLRTRHNQFALISQLPPKVLSQIFQCFILEYGTASAPTYWSVHEQPPDLPFMTVCRHWRQTALDFPFVWSTINCQSQYNMKKFLSRSRNMPLDVSVSPILSETWMTCALAHLRQTRTLHLDLSDYLMYRVGERLLQHAPLLTSFSIKLPRLTTCHPRHVAYFTALDAPQLHTMHLFRVPYHWDKVFRKLQVQNLRSLNITLSPHDTADITKMILALQQMPLLEQLAFHSNTTCSGVPVPEDCDCIVALNSLLEL
jgi:hypothetical protein